MGYDNACPVFTFRRSGDSPLITLTGVASQTLDIESGTRVLLRYQPENGEAYTSGPVAVKYVLNINQDVLRQGDITGWDADPLYLLSMWRSGEYINMEAEVVYSETSRRFALVADESTLNDANPQLYLVHDTKNAPDNFSRRIYASWNVAALWNRTGCRSITIHVNDSNRGLSTITFSKSE
jgi:hypothetical protein